MKTFTQYITESQSLQDVMVKRWSNPVPETVKGLINPSKEQVQGFVDKHANGHARFILHNNRLTVWRGEDAIHGEVAKAEHPDLGRDTYFSIEKHPHSLFGSFYLNKNGNLVIGISDKSSTDYRRKLFNPNALTVDEVLRLKLPHLVPEEGEVSSHLDT